MNMYVSTCIGMYVCMYLHTFIYLRMCVCVTSTCGAGRGTPTHNTHTQTSTQTQTHKHTHTHTHTEAICMVRWHLSSSSCLRAGESHAASPICCLTRTDRHKKRTHTHTHMCVCVYLCLSGNRSTHTDGSKGHSERMSVLVLQR